MAGSPFWPTILAALAAEVLCSACAFSHPDASNEARMLVAKGQPAQAARELETDLQKRPGAKTAVPERRLLIRIYASMGQLGQARAHAETLAKELGPGSPVPWVELGYALELTHRYDEALEQYDRAAEVAPRDPLGPLTGGMRAARWGEVDLAEPRLGEALRRDPQNASAWHALGLVRARRGDLDGATVAYKSGLEADPRALEDHVGLATIALLQGNAAGALIEYDAIVSARPKFADAQLGRSWALLKLGRLDDAQRALDRARDLGASGRSLAAQQRALDSLRSPAAAH